MHSCFSVLWISVVVAWSLTAVATEPISDGTGLEAGNVAWQPQSVLDETPLIASDRPLTVAENRDPIGNDVSPEMLKTLMRPNFSLLIDLP